MHIKLRVLVDAETEEIARAILEETIINLVERYSFDYGEVVAVYDYDSEEGKREVRRAFKWQWKNFMEGYKVVKSLLEAFSPRDLYYGRPLSKRAKRREVWEKICQPEKRLTSYLSFWTAYLSSLARRGTECFVWLEDLPIRNEEELEEILKTLPKKTRVWVGIVDMHY